MEEKNNKKGFFERLKSGLAKTRKLLMTDVDDILLGSKEIDQALFDELEEALIAADVGPAFTGELIESLKGKVKRKELGSPEILRKALRETMREILRRNETPLRIPPDRIYTIMVVGVNGTGKTTTIGKMARNLKAEGHGITLVAADTFRAAAIEQLDAWAKRAAVPLIRQAANADPAAVVFDAPGPTFRHEMYAPYKAQRTATPEPLIQQIAPVTELVRALGIPLVVSDGCEADDCIAGLAYRFKDSRPVVIIGSDKDFKQCLAPGVIFHL